jgi:hypothetical protein
MGVDRGVQGAAEGGVGLDATSPGHVCPGQTSGSWSELETDLKHWNLRGNLTALFSLFNAAVVRVSKSVLVIRFWFDQTTALIE